MVPVKKWLVRPILFHQALHTRFEGSRKVRTSSEQGFRQGLHTRCEGSRKVRTSSEQGFRQGLHTRFEGSRKVRTSSEQGFRQGFRQRFPAWFSLFSVFKVHFATLSLSTEFTEQVAELCTRYPKGIDRTSTRTHQVERSLSFL